MEIENNEEQSLVEVKNDVLDLKDMYNDIMKTINEKESFLNSREVNLTNLFDTLKSETIKLAFGDYSCEILIKKLVKFKNSFFSNYIYDYHQKFQTYPKSLFFDKNLKCVKKVVNYLRTGIINLINIDLEERKEILKFVQFLGLWDLSHELLISVTEAKFFKLENLCQSHINSDLDIRNINLDDGKYNFSIYNALNYEIIFRFLYDIKATSIDIRGYKGSITSNCGASAIIHSSMNGIDYIKIGTIPTTYGDNIIRVSLDSISTFRFLKFKHTSQIGIGYLNINVVKDDSIREIII